MAGLSLSRKTQALATHTKTGIMLTLTIASCQPSVPQHLALQSIIFTPSLSLSASVPMPDRYENQSTEQPEAFPGQMEWLYDTMDEKQPQTDRRPRRGFPCGTFLILGIGLAILAGLSWLLFGQPLPANVPPPVTNTPTLTVALPSPSATILPVGLPSRTPTARPTLEAAFEVGDRVAIGNTSSQGVRVRAGAGLDFLTQGIYYDGDTFIVIPNSDPKGPYPVEVDGYTWWRLRAADGLIGWTVEEFLIPAPLISQTATPTPGT